MTRTTAAKTSACPGWCETHRVDDRGRRFHLSVLKRVNGLTVGLQVDGRDQRTVVVFHHPADYDPVAVIDITQPLAHGLAICDSLGMDLGEVLTAVSDFILPTMAGVNR
jgi:hypothetical protein